MIDATVSVSVPTIKNIPKNSQWFTMIDSIRFDQIFF